MTDEPQNMRFGPVICPETNEFVSDDPWPEEDAELPDGGPAGHERP